ncbi:hypothetical protein I3842_05G067800 [Carya illinoinensis]|uniref:Uncharacterized protein n=1 Tax=Carya illinoinensis TaxID=32201 RepID=A0A922JKZ9_CARIL|nr:hypothetical protein I3842_05G067800 [Carya illinoinensis]
MFADHCNQTNEIMPSSRVCHFKDSCDQVNTMKSGFGFEVIVSLQVFNEFLLQIRGAGRSQGIDREP